jgi:hypothetical protein
VFSPDANEIAAVFEFRPTDATDWRNVIALLKSFDGSILYSKRFID